MKEKSQRGEHRVIKGQSRRGKRDGERDGDRRCGSAWRVSGVKELWFTVMSQLLPAPHPSLTTGPTPPPTRTLQQLFNMEIDLNRS